MSWHWTILQARRRIEPTSTVRLHNERRIAGDCFHTLRVWRGSIAGRLVWLEIRYVIASPFGGLLIPPDIFLALGPWLSIGIGRRAVIHHPSVMRPGEAPVRLCIIVRARLARPRAVAAFGIDSAIYPAATSGAAIILQIRKAIHLLAVGYGIAVNFLKDFFNIRLAQEPRWRSVG